MNRKSFFIVSTLAVLLVLLSACATAPREVQFARVTYSNRQVSGDSETYTNPSGQTLTIQRAGDAHLVTAGEQVYRVSGSPNRVEVTFPDGRGLVRQYERDSAAGFADFGADVTLADWERVDELREMVFQTGRSQRSADFTGRLLLAAALFGLGLLQVLNPRLAWQIVEGWRYSNLEPSEIYLGLSRVAGVVLMVIALLIALQP